MTPPVRIRPFRAADAPRLAEWIDRLAPADELFTPGELIRYRQVLPRRRHPLWLVALLDGQPVALARDETQIFGGPPGLRRVWVGVRPDQRHRGIGTELWQRIEAHARQAGALMLGSWSVADVPDGERFVRARGLDRVHRSLQSWIDPASVDARELRDLAAAASQRGFEVRALRELPPSMEAALCRLFLNADRATAADGPNAPSLALSTFRRVFLSNPLLDLDCSVVVLHAGEPVALSWLKGDRRVGKYAVELTATNAAWRGHGLATLAKRAALQRAAQAGIRWLGTSNDDDNAPMLAINRKLGHQRLPDLLFYQRAVEEPR